MGLMDRIAGVVMRGIVTLVDDAKKLQALQLELTDEDDVVDEVEHFQPYGVSFRPPADAEAIVVSVGSDQDHLVALAVQSRSKRPTGIEEEEGGLYCLGEFKVFLDKNGIVHLGAKSGAAKVARDDRVEAELSKIKTELSKIQTTLTTGTSPSGTVSFTTPYTNGYTSVGSTGADKAKVT